MTNEAAHISATEQLLIKLRYLGKAVNCKHTIHESFVRFIQLKQQDATLFLVQLLCVIKTKTRCKISKNVNIVN